MPACRPRFQPRTGPAVALEYVRACFVLGLPCYTHARTCGWLLGPLVVVEVEGVESLADGAAIRHARGRRAAACAPFKRVRLPCGSVVACFPPNNHTGVTCFLTSCPLLLITPRAFSLFKKAGVVDLQYHPLDSSPRCYNCKFPRYKERESPATVILVGCFARTATR